MTPFDVMGIAALLLVIVIIARLAWEDGRASRAKAKRVASARSRIPSRRLGYRRVRGA